MDAPDYSKQVASDKSLGSNPQGPLKEQLYSAKESQAEPSPLATEDFEEVHERRGRTMREPSGATSARSGSLARQSNASQSPSSSGNTSHSPSSNASQSPSRAMGARSISADKATSGRQRKGLDTIEGVGSSVGPQINPDAFEGRRVRVGRRDSSDDNAQSRFTSPSRAMGARSTITE
ncbi:MAG: hypothetical protein CYPHOPRED_006023 [Cyphobasidiales sp. Tagirdzhanova-0007]|nr:MAG: hypothetical protein CYPHOPRED_006023 [Cyphobasidiales sp. Tagirdzhanova-0007]